MVPRQTHFSWLSGARGEAVETGSEDELVLPVADNWEPRAQEEPPVEIFESPERLLRKGIRHLLLHRILPQS